MLPLFYIQKYSENTEFSNRKDFIIKSLYFEKKQVFIIKYKMILIYKFKGGNEWQ